MINDTCTPLLETGIAALDALGLQLLIDRDAASYLRRYQETRRCRPDRILDSELTHFPDDSFHRLSCYNRRGEVVAYCAARCLHLEHDLLTDARHLPPPHPVDDWSASCHLELKGRHLEQINGKTIYLGGLWVRPNIGVPQIAMWMPRLLVAAIIAAQEDVFNWVWGIFDTKAGIHLGSMYGFDRYTPIEFLLHRQVGTSMQRTQCLSDQALSWARPSDFIGGLALALQPVQAESNE